MIRRQIQSGILSLPEGLWAFFQDCQSKMYETTDKRRIYWLIGEFISGRMSAISFCDEFHTCFDLDVDLATLTSVENEYFARLSEVASRFSDDPDDFVRYPNAFACIDDLSAAVASVIDDLSNK